NRSVGRTLADNKRGLSEIDDGRRFDLAEIWIQWREDRADLRRRREQRDDIEICAGLNDDAILTMDPEIGQRARHLIRSLVDLAEGQLLVVEDRRHPVRDRARSVPEKLADQQVHHGLRLWLSEQRY